MSRTGQSRRTSPAWWLEGTYPRGRRLRRAAARQRPGGVHGTEAVKLLLETHVVLWWRLDSSRLTRAVRQRIATADVVWVSAASGWEAAIKQGLGKLRLADSFAWMVEDSGFDELPVPLHHAEQVAMLPPHHADRFDRMLVAQACVEAATIVTHDPQFERYGIPVVRL